jgi:hypothetical protein
MHTESPTMRRIIIAVTIGLVSAVLCYQYQVAFARGGGDVSWPLCAGRALLAGTDPYACQVRMMTGVLGPTNPLTAALAMLPLVWMADPWAAAVFFGGSSALLAYGLTSNDAWWRLLVFLSFPYWNALQTVQWSPLLFAVALYPSLLPLTLVKPHIGAVIAITHLTRRRVAACIAFGLLSLVVDPTWPLRWLPQTSTYEGMVPLLVLPGPLLLLALTRWRDERARVVLAMAAVPQRLWYDSFLLWLVPRTPRQMLLLAGLSWGSYFAWYFVPTFGLVWHLTLVYLPVLAMVLWPKSLSSQLTPAVFGQRVGRASIPRVE